jgi:hypothetical protein
MLNKLYFLLIFKLIKSEIFSNKLILDAIKNALYF